MYRVHSIILRSSSTRRMSYRILNPSLVVHEVYSSLEVKENERIAFTRFRLSSHHLAFEMGRWSRIPVENRLCPCGAIQSDAHVMLHCPFTLVARNAIDADLAELFGVLSLNDICLPWKAVLNC